LAATLTKALAGQSSLITPPGRSEK
jgi:hypothetical protein